MDEIRLATRGQITRVLELMEVTGNDLIHVIQQVLCETGFANQDDADTLAWFPESFLYEAIKWLEAEETKQLLGELTDTGETIP